MSIAVLARFRTVGASGALRPLELRAVGANGVFDSLRRSAAAPARRQGRAGTPRAAARRLRSRLAGDPCPRRPAAAQRSRTPWTAETRPRGAPGPPAPAWPGFPPPRPPPPLRPPPRPRPPPPPPPPP